MGLMDIVVVNVALPHILSALGISERVSRAAELRRSPEQADVVVQALYGWTVSRAGSTIAYQAHFMLATAGLFAVALPGLILSHGRKYCGEAA